MADAGRAPHAPGIDAGAADRPAIEVFDYDEHECREYEFQGDDYASLPPGRRDAVRWINVDGLNDAGLLERICRPFGIHALVLGDILDPNLRAKIVDYDGYLYIVAKMVSVSGGALVHEQVSVILGEGYVLTFGEQPGDVFDRVRERIRSEGAPIRRHGADYLVYALLDAIVDGVFDVLEAFGDRIDEGEEELLSDPSLEYLHKMRDIKKGLLYMHKAIWPLREVASWMAREESALIAESTQVYIRDVYGHIIQAIDTTETYRELLSGIMDMYLSSISNKMNQIMKVLTIIATIFIPLTFIAGLYGMNFQFMPELGWTWGYPAVLLLMAAVAVYMLAYFKRKKWF